MENVIDFTPTLPNVQVIRLISDISKKLYLFFALMNYIFYVYKKYNMSERGTPITQLRNDSNGQDNSEIVSNILNQMEQNDQSQVQQPSPQPKTHQEQENFDEQYYEDEPVPVFRPQTFSEKLLSEAKLPLLVVLLVFVANFNQFNKLLAEYVPRMVGSDGNINVFGLLFKAVLIGVLFYVVKKFVL